MQFNNWSLTRFVLPKHTFSPIQAIDLNIYHWHFEKSEKQGFRLNFVPNFSLHEHHDNCTFSRIEQLFNCHSIKAGTYFENSNTKNLDLQVKMCCTPNKLFLGKKDLTVAYLTYSKIKTFFKCAYLNSLDVFKFYESRQCYTKSSLTTLHNLKYVIFPFCNSCSHLQNCMQFSMCNTCTILYYPF